MDLRASDGEGGEKTTWQLRIRSEFCLRGVRPRRQPRINVQTLELSVRKATAGNESRRPDVCECDVSSSVRVARAADRISTSYPSQRYLGR